MSLFQQGDFKLHSGGVSKWKIECDALTDEDWKTLAVMMRQTIGPFSSVEGVPTGGLKLAEYLKPMCVENTYTHLIVDDVLTTGNSMEDLRKFRQLNYEGNLIRIIGGVVFARGPCPNWVIALFKTPTCM